MNELDKKKLPLKEQDLSTWVDDPYGLESTQEVLEAQDNPDELDLDGHLDSDLEKISQAISKQDLINEKESALLQSDKQPDLKTQIAEDQALEKETLPPPPDVSSVFSSFTQLDEAEIASCIETLIFLADKPISARKLQELLGPEFELSLFHQAIQTIQARYQSKHHGFELLEIAGGFQFRTKPGRAFLAQKLAKIQTQRLSTGAMESLAIIAYQQPIMKEEIDKIRGVDSSYFIRGLLEKKLIQISGRSELPGRPLLYSTTTEFLEIFGLKNLSCLPPLRELEQMIPGSESKNPEDTHVRQMKKLVNEMNLDKKSVLDYDPQEDEKILKEFRNTITAIPSSTAYLDQLNEELKIKVDEENTKDQT